MRFFYLEVRIGALLPGAGPLMGDSLPAQQPSDPLVRYRWQYPFTPAVVVQLLHRPGSEGEPQVLWAGQRHTDELSYLFTGYGGGPALAVGGFLEGREARRVEALGPVVDDREMDTYAVGYLGGLPALGGLLDDAIALVLPDRHRLVL